MTNSPMSNIDKQALREAAATAKIAGEAPIMPFDQRITALNDFMKHCTPDTVLALLEAAEKQIVPEEMPKGLAGQIVSLLAHNIGDKFLAQKIWNACRTAIHQSAENTESRCTMQPASALDSLPQNADSRCSNSPVFPDGWVIVPVEPTEEMLAELCLVKGWTARALNARYQAMLAAAPKPEA
ncbi:Uncharacterised protein [Enterobacter asburiae]|uniref:Eaa1 n=2 Tax=Enterobacter asburiae TaxID=61645 RepID=A0A376FJP2_ENTAS|nr:Uncharacterised protein [Enterobacter asburiae]